MAENAILPIALGRKNYLFAGSARGAEWATMFYSFFGTCKKNDVNPYEWLGKVLEIIPKHKVNVLHQLLLQNIKLLSIQITAKKHILNNLSMTYLAEWIGGIIEI